MERIPFKITIDASKEKIWDILWGKTNYPKWASVFDEGSRAETDWKEGSKVLFVGSKGDGMVSTIVENKPNEFMSIKHLGFVKDGVEDFDSEMVKAWAGAMENYTLKTVNGKTELVVDMDMTDDHKKYFTENWPRAMEKIKELAEKK